ncbi:MAG: right-handed parallel beta-helix repeat-containing protein, partial [Actinobacteria bacterium]|nr:right-handed parallel beta-helix repeat-containing protein [Actinomycetota bacterium]
RDNRIFGNNVVNNGPFGGIGLYSEIDADHLRTTSGLSTGNVIDSNTVVDNRIGRAGTVAGTDNDGIRVEPGTPGNFILNNRVTGNGLDGIALFRRSPDNVIRGNISSDNGLRTSARRGDGIRVFPDSDRTIIEGNLTVRNGDNGIIVGSLNNRIVGNTSLFNRAFPPLNVNNLAVDLRDQNPTCDNNVWLDNRYGTVNPPCAGDTP